MSKNFSGETTWVIVRVDDNRLDPDIDPVPHPPQGQRGCPKVTWRPPELNRNVDIAVGALCSSSIGPEQNYLSDRKALSHHLGVLADNRDN